MASLDIEETFQDLVFETKDKDIIRAFLNFEDVRSNFNGFNRPTIFLLQDKIFETKDEKLIRKYFIYSNQYDNEYISNLRHRGACVDRFDLFNKKKSFQEIILETNDKDLISAFNDVQINPSTYPILKDKVFETKNAKLIKDLFSYRDQSNSEYMMKIMGCNRTHPNALQDTLDGKFD